MFLNSAKAQSQSTFTQQQMPKPQSQQPQQQTSFGGTAQLDQLITRQLHQQKGIPFAVLGTSNGIIMDNLFKEKAFVYIDSLNVNKRLVFDLCIVTLQFGNHAQSRKLVRRIPLAYSGPIVKEQMDEVQQVRCVQIKMQQAPNEQYIFAIKISIIYKQASIMPKDTVSVLILDPAELSQQSLSPLKQLHLLKLKCGDSQISDYMWHPLSNLTILVLTHNEVLEIWDLNDEDFLKPSHILKIKNIKNNYKLALDVKFKKLGLLCTDYQSSMAGNKSIGTKIKNSNKINYNKFTLFLMNSLGQIISIYPFLPTGCSITKQQYDNIYDTEHLSQQKAALTLYLNKCQLTQSQSSTAPHKQQDSGSQQQQQFSHYTVTNIPGIQSHYQVQKWYKNQSQFQNTDLTKLLKQKYYYEFKFVALPHDCILVIEVVHQIHRKCNNIWISIINKYVEIDENINVDNVIYQIMEIRNQNKNQYDDVRFIKSDSKANMGLQQVLFYTEKNKLYKLDLSTAFKFVQSNNLKELQDDNAFATSLVFQLNNNQSIVAMGIQQSLNIINFIRRTQNHIKFQIQPLSNLGAFQQIQNITKLSNDLLSKVNNLRVQNIERSITKQDSSNQLNMSAQQIAKYQQKGVQEVKRDYTKYCENLKNGIDDGMSKLKTSYEIMKKRLKKFNNFKDKRNQLNQLLEQVQTNNQIINNLLFAENNNTNQTKSTSFAQMELNVNSLKSLLETAKNKKLVINPQTQARMGQQINFLFDKLRTVRIKLDEAKKMKKEIEYHKN